jgi:hypothetical protein
VADPDPFGQLLDLVVDAAPLRYEPRLYVFDFFLVMFMETLEFVESEGPGAPPGQSELFVWGSPTIATRTANHMQGAASLDFACVVTSCW